MADPAVNVNSNPNAPANSTATANAPAIPTQDSDLSDQRLQAPQSAPPAQPLQLQPSTPSASSLPVAATSPNKRLHLLVGKVLSALAGEPPATYHEDSTTGKMIADIAPKEGVTDKLRRITNHALIGLSAGAQVGPQKSAAASIAAGLGAGAGAVNNKMSAEDLAAQKTAAEEFDRAQKAKIQAMEISKANGYNLNLYYHNVKLQNDLDPVRAQNQEIADAFRNIPGHIVTEMDADAARAAVNDPNNPTWPHTHLILPAGMQPVTDGEGNPVKDAAGNFKSKGRVYVIDGTKDGKIPLPASLVSDIQKFKNYGELANSTSLDKLEPGQELEPYQFVRLYNALLSTKIAVEKGWNNPDLSEDKDGNVIQHNSVDATMTKPATEAQNQKFQMDKANLAEKQQKIKTDKSTEAKNFAEADKAKKATETESRSDLTGEDYLKTLPNGRQATVRAVHEGRMLLPANRKEALAILEGVNQSFPDDFDEAKSKTWQKTNNEYRGSGATAKKVVSYNTALEHMQDLYTNTTADGIFNPVSKAHQDREVAMGYVANEVGNAIKNGVMSKEEGQKILSDLSGGITPANKRERIAETARLLHDKIEEYQNKFNEGAPSSAVKVPILISPRAAASYDFVQSGGKTQASSQSGQTAQSVGHKVGDTIVQNGRTFTVTSVDANGKVTGAQ